MERGRQAQEADVRNDDPCRSDADDHFGRHGARVGRPRVDRIGPAKAQIGTELAPILPVDTDHVQARGAATYRPERDEPAVRRAADSTCVVSGRKDIPDRSITRVDRLKLSSDGNDERPIRDRPVHRPHDRECNDGRQDEQHDGADDAQRCGHRLPARASDDQANIALEAADPTCVSDSCRSNPRKQRRVGRPLEFLIRIRRHIQPPDQCVNPLVSHPDSPRHTPDEKLRALGTGATR